MGMAHTAEEIAAWLVEHLAAILGLTPEGIDPQEDFTSYGLSSTDAALLSGDLEDWLGWRLEPAVAWEYPTIAMLSQYLAGEQTHQSGQAHQPKGVRSLSFTGIQPLTTAERSLEELVFEIEQLSDEDVQNALNQDKS